MTQVEAKVDGDRLGVVRLALALSATVLVLALAACGDSEDDSGATTSAGNVAAGEDAAKSGDQTVSAGVSDYMQYIGAKGSGAADPDKAPIVIGWVNQQGGPTDIGPGATKGADLAVRWLNEKAGGIDGHPVKLFTCFTSTSEEQGQGCGQKMVNNDDVKVVAVGAVVTGSQSLDATIAGEKPMVFSIAAGPSDAKAKNAYALFGDGPHVLKPFSTYVADVVKATSVAVVGPEVPGLMENGTTVVEGLKQLGVPSKRVSWSPNATDLVGPLTAAGGQSADVIVTDSDPKGCVNLAKAIDQLGIETPVVAEPLCINEQVSKALGDFPRWTYGIATTLASDMSDPTAQAYAELTDEMGVPAQYSQDNWIPASFHAMLTLFQWMNGIGADDISEETIAEAAKAFEGPQAWGAPTIECGKYPEAPAICNDQAKFFDYEGDGVFKPAGGWQRSPE